MTYKYGQVRPDGLIWVGWRYTKFGEQKPKFMTKAAFDKAAEQRRLRHLRTYERKTVRHGPLKMGTHKDGMVFVCYTRHSNHHPVREYWVTEKKWKVVKARRIAYQEKLKLERKKNRERHTAKNAL